jgi:methionyl-tRNA synthetase
MKNSLAHFYVTTPIYYVTAKPHLGSLYSTLLADVAARWQKLRGKEVFFLTGTDEHGQKIAQAAAAAHMEPKKFVDQFIAAYQKIWHEYNLDYSYFIRTTDPVHVAAVQEWLKKLLATGDIYKGFYQGWYCTHCETFVAEIVDEGEAAPLCPSCNRITHEVAEESYFFRLSAYQDKLLAFYEKNPDFIVPRERSNEVYQFVKAGLRDLSISRTTVTWGIPFPGDEKHVTYVWADALNNYITAIGYGQKGKEEEFKKWWPADLQILGKDIIRFHAVYWPAFLMAAGLPTPKQLLVHGWIKINDQKMSKSFGNVVEPEKLYTQYGADPVRYYLMRQMSISQDTNFSLEDLEQRIESDLANDLGNLLNRMAVLAQKNGFFKIVPPKVWHTEVLSLREKAWNMIEDMQTHMAEGMFHLALASVWKYINQLNAFFHASEPWKVVKTDKEKASEILSAVCHGLYTVAILLWPVMPASMEQLLLSLGVSLPAFTHGSIINSLAQDGWHHTFAIEKIPNLFNKPEKIMQTPENTTVKTIGSYIDITDFAKVQLAVGTILVCEPVPNSDKLYRLEVDCGNLGKRQILTGLRQLIPIEKLLNKQGIFVLNLKPRTMAGLQSEGMLLTAFGGNKAILTVSEAVDNGSLVK